MSYDTKCYKLAEAFMVDVRAEEPEMTEDAATAHTKALAQVIQNEIENYIEELSLKPSA